MPTIKHINNEHCCCGFYKEIHRILIGKEKVSPSAFFQLVLLRPAINGIKRSLSFVIRKNFSTRESSFYRNSLPQQVVDAVGLYAACFESSVCLYTFTAKELYTTVHHRSILS